MSKMTPMPPPLPKPVVSRDVTMADAMMLVFVKRGVSVKQEEDALMFVLYDDTKTVEVSPGKKSPAEYFRCRVPLTIIPPETLNKINELRLMTPQHEVMTPQGVMKMTELDAETELLVVADAVLNSKVTADTKTERLIRIKKLLDTGYHPSIVEDTPNKRWLLLFHKTRENGLNSGARLWLNDSEMPDVPAVQSWRTAHTELEQAIALMASQGGS